MASSPPQDFDLIKAAEALLAGAKKLPAVSFSYSSPTTTETDAMRRQIAMTAKKIASEVAPAIDVVKSDWPVLADAAAWNIFMEWKVFDHIPLPNINPNGISFADLSKAVNAQESLIARIAGLLIATGKLRSVVGHPENVTHSRISPLYRSSHPASALAAVAFGNGMRPYAQWASYFAQYGRREPTSVNHTPFSFSWGHPDLSPWEIKALYPEYGSNFARSMKSRQIVGGDMKLTGPEALYDFSWVGQEAGKRKGEKVVVDVGGGLGQLLRDVVSSVEGVDANQCVLQDRSEVIDEAREAAAAGDEVMKDVVMMEHDFHTEQPVKGATVYLLRRILLDYPDEMATGILRRLAEAIPEDNHKARVIIMEERLLEMPTPMNRIVDMVMLNIGGKLRNEKTFGEIASAAGLKLAGYYAREGDQTCVVECARA
ncbi:O-methyltransferase-domain-containing protein [Apodospora peruviana]|uniref:O-methyltransferase-domain-containing protein n=1 Tax=Apodospora peruviana TaxID=516989 RepID=A0AAE0HWJ7_9PEZI|nr:O-methyltransferase-domain-containing protein [Apodospora peruviana]